MNLTAYAPSVFVALFGWPFVAVLLALWLTPRRAIIATFVLGWLLLPNAEYYFSGLPDYSKVEAIAVAAAVVSIGFDHKRLFALRPRAVDIPMICYCAVPLASSVSNDLGVYDGLSTITERTLEWGVPYIVGRLYFPSFAAMRELALGVVMGGILYVPLCLFELRMSPQLHRMVYGFHQHTFVQVRRFGGWRPMVFMQHGLALGLYMGGAAFVAIWLWSRRAVTHVFSVPTSLVGAGLAVVAVACKSLGSVLLVFIGMATLYVSRWMRLRALILILVLAIPTYMALRAPKIWTAQNLLNTAWSLVPSRAKSLQTRIDSEDILATKALQRPMFGWGGWGRNRVRNARGKELAIPDGLWIITLGTSGIVGLVAFTIAMLLPIVLFFSRAPPAVLYSRECAAATAMAMMVIIFMLDCLLNAMPNPLIVLATGGLSGMMPSREHAHIMRMKALSEAKRREAFNDALAAKRARGTTQDGGAS